MKRYAALAPVFAGLGKAMVLNRSRDFRNDCLAAVAALESPPVILGRERIPVEGGFLLVANHWQRPGHWIGFTAAALSISIFERRGPDDQIRWIATDRWNVRLGGSEFHLPFSETLFRRVAKAWGLLPVSTGAGRGSSPAGLRALLRFVVSGGVAAIFPEGEWARAGPPGKVIPGADHLVRLLGSRGIPTLPAAFAEIRGQPYVRFGNPSLSNGDKAGESLTTALRREFQALLDEAAAQ